MREEPRSSTVESVYWGTKSKGSAPRWGLASLGLVLLLSGQSLACGGATEHSATRTADPEPPAEVLVLPPPTGTSCDLETDARRTAEIVALLESDGPPLESEHTLADWQTLNADYQKAWAAAKSEAAFIEYWHGLGGNTDPYGFSDLFRRTTQGDAVALRELQKKYPGKSYLGMAFSAASSALAQGNSEVAATIIASVDRGLLNGGQRVELAASLLGLGKTSEALSVLEVTPKEDHNISPHAGGIILLHFIDEHGGIEEGVAVSSSMAAAHLIAPGERVLVTGGPGVVEAVEQRGATALINDGRVIDGPVDAVVVGLDRSFDYARLTVATTALLAGARLIATNTDSTFPTPHGLVPGGGAIVAAIATAGGATPVIGGKPHQPMADLIADMLTTNAAAFDPDRTLMVGDRPDTDGLFASRLRCRFALVRSGVPSSASEATAAGVPVDLDVADLAEVARMLISGSPSAH